MIRLSLLLLLAGACGRSPYAPRNSQLVSSPTFLRFVARVGDVVEPQVASLFEARTGDVCWRASIPVTWVAVSRANGCGPAAIAVSVATRDIAPGTHRTVIQFIPTSPGTHLGAAITVELELTAPGWTGLDGPWSGTMTAIAVDPSDANRVVAGGSDLFISSDGGVSFSESAVDFGSKVAVSTIALTDTGRGYLTLESTGGVGGVWWSDDHGSTWQASTAGSIDLLALAVHLTDPMVALAVGNGVYVTGDGGVSWTQTDTFSSLAVVADDGGFWIGNDDGTLHRSADGTATTLAHTFYDNPGDSGSNALPVHALAALANGTLFASTGGNNPRLWRSGDGTTWERATATGAVLTANTNLASDGNDLWTLEERIYVSADAGDTFTEVPVSISPGLDRKRFHDMALHPDGHLLAHDNLGVVRRSGAGWAQGALAADVIRDLEFDATTSTLYGVGLLTGAFAHDAIGFRGLGGNGLTAGQAWNISIDPRNGAHITVGGAIVGTGVFRSTNFGNDWTFISSIPSGTCIYSLERAPDEPDVIWIAGCSGLYRSIDAGLSYTVLDTDHEPGMVAAISAEVAIYTRSGLRRYDTAVGAFETLFSSPTPSFIARTVDGSLWWSATGYGLQRSGDGGTTFDQVSAEVTGIRDLAMHPHNHDHVLVATTDSLLASRDGGATWEDTGSPFPPYSLLLDADPDSEAVWVGTDGGGLYRYLAP